MCLIPTIIIWSPLEQFSFVTSIDLSPCPKCCDDSSSDSRLVPTCWSDGTLNQHQPRLLYGSSCNAILVSRVYKCFNDHYVYGHNPVLFQRLKQSIMESLIPFALWHISGFTQPLLDLIEQLIQSGTSLQQIETNLKANRVAKYYHRKDKYDKVTGMQMRSSTTTVFPEYDNAPLKWWGDFPTLHSISACYLLRFWDKEKAYVQRMRQVSVSSEAAWNSCDHTFRSIVNIGLVRDSDKRWIMQYNGLFCTLNDVGEVLTWKLTRSLSFEHIKETVSLLHDRLKNQGKTVAEFYVDNCCSWRDSLQGIF